MSSKDIRISIHLRNDPNILKITEIVYDNSNIKINVMKVVDNKKISSIYYKRRTQNSKQSSLLKTLINR